MAMRSVVSRCALGRLVEARPSAVAGLRHFSDGKGRVLEEEERAKENVYIQKWERERLEKQKQKQKLEAEKEKAKTEKADEKPEGGSS